MVPGWAGGFHLGLAPGLRASPWQRGRHRVEVRGCQRAPSNRAMGRVLCRELRLRSRVPSSARCRSCQEGSVSRVRHPQSRKHDGWCFHRLRVETHGAGRRFLSRDLSKSVTQGLQPAPRLFRPAPSDASHSAPVGGSSNGRTPDSDSGCLGSNPSPPANSLALISKSLKLLNLRVWLGVDFAQSDT